MSRITKQIAITTDSELVKGKIEKVRELKKLFEDRLKLEVLKTIDKEILHFSQKHPSYVRKSTDVKIVGNGFNHESASIDISLPTCNGNYATYFNPEVKVAEELMQLMRTYKKEKDLVNKLKKDLEIIIFNLKTYKAVQENFPETFEVLPKTSEYSSCFKFNRHSR
jgi:hypothetical protein